MTQRKTFLLRLDPATHEALQRWANSEMRSLNAQIEFLLRRALAEAGRARPGVLNPEVADGTGGQEGTRGQQE
jgi:hypothetical protein